MSVSHQSFTVMATVNKIDEEVTVTPIETTDGVVYYSCCIDGQELSQIRKEIYGKWEQLWGDLDERAVATLGEAIDMHNIDQ
jgi:hypothetical protein